MQITDLPFSLYSTFVIESRHGFNKVRYVVVPTLPCVLAFIYNTCGLNLLIISICSKQYGCSLGTWSKEYFSLSY